MTKTYTYVALDSAGQRQTGVVNASTERQARDWLAGRGFLVETVTEAKEATDDRNVITKSVVAPIVGRVNFETLQRFFAQLHSMYKAGVPLVQSLDTLGTSSEHGRLKAVVLDIREFVLQGKRMSEGMEKYPEVFSPLLISLVRVGEQGGVLERSLQQCSEYLGREVKLRNQAKRATFYPKLILVVIIFIPIITQIVISMLAPNSPIQLNIFSLSGQAWFWPLIIALVAFYILFIRIGLQVSAIREAWHRLLLRVPYLGQTLHMLAMAKFGRAFSALYSGGVPITEAVRMSAAACGNDYIAKQIAPAAGWLAEGRGIAESFQRTGVFSRVALDMAYTGEQSGSMEPMLDNVAEQYEDEAEVRHDKMMKVFPVVLILLAGVMVGYIVISFYQSYFSAIFEAAG